MANESKIIEVKIVLEDAIQKLSAVEETIKNLTAEQKKLNTATSEGQKRNAEIIAHLKAEQKERATLVTAIAKEINIQQERAKTIDRQVDIELKAMKAAEEAAKKRELQNARDASLVESILQKRKAAAEQQEATIVKLAQKENEAAVKKEQAELKKQMADKKSDVQAAISADKKIGYINQLKTSVQELEQQYYRLTEAELKGAKGKEVLTALKEKRAELSQLNEAYGNYSLGVGNYGRATDNLSIQLGQVMKELPNFAISARIGIMSLTNNLPMLAEAFKQVKVQQAEMIAQGQKAPSMFSLITKSVFGLTGIVSLAMVALQYFSDDIIRLITNTTKADEAQKKFNDTLKEGSSIYNTSAKSINEMDVKLRLASQGLLDSDGILKEYNSTLGNTFGVATDVKGAMENIATYKTDYLNAMVAMAAANTIFEESTRKASEALAMERAGKPGFLDYLNTIDKTIGTAFDPRNWGVGAFPTILGRLANTSTITYQNYLNDIKNLKDGSLKDISSYEAEIEKIKNKYKNEPFFSQIFGGDSDTFTKLNDPTKTKQATKIIVDSIDEIIAKLTHIDIGLPFDDFNKAVGESLKTWEDSIDLRLDMKMGMANRMKKISDDMAKEDSDALERKLDKEKKAADESAKIEMEKEQRKKKIKESFEREAQLMLASINDFANSIAERELQNYSQMIAGKANYDELYAQKKYELQYEAAKREKALGVFSTLVDTASAIIGYLADPGGVAGTILSIMAGTTGAIQTASILSQPLPVPPTASTGSKISGTSTVKFHTGGVAGSTPDSPQRSEEITRTLLTTERVLSPQQTSIFDSMISSIASRGGADSIVGNVGANSTSFDTVYAAMSKALQEMPAPVMTWQEFERQQQRQQRLKANAMLK